MATSPGQAPLSSTIGGRVQVKVQTNNYIIPMNIGPQVMWPTGAVRPYVNAGLGGQAFLTESHVETESGSSIASTTNHSAFAPSWVAGAGVYLPVVSGRAKVSLDLGMQYLRGGRADYLTTGSIVDLPDSQIHITPSRSDTHMIVVKIGARIGW
jgi:opacity protein-like surface antigen